MSRAGRKRPAPPPPPKVRAVHPGDTYSRGVEGGVHREEVPGLGVVVDLPGEDVFIGAEQIEGLMDDLGYSWHPPLPGPTRRRR